VLGVPDPQGVLSSPPLPPPATVNSLGVPDPQGVLGTPQDEDEWKHARSAHGVDTQTGGGFGTRTALSFIPESQHAAYLQQQHGADNVLKVGPNADDLAYREGPDKPFISVHPYDRPWYTPSVGSIGARVGEAPVVVGGIAGGVVGAVPGAALGAGAGEM